MKTNAKGICVGLCAIAVVGFVYWFRSDRLPSDEKTKRYFLAHQVQFEALANSLIQRPSVSFLDTGGNGDDAELLKKVGGQFLRQADGAAMITVWGSGCAVCHDSYEGYMHISLEAPAWKYLSVVSALDRDLPKDKRGGIEDGCYVLPLVDGWYVFRRENG